MLTENSGQIESGEALSDRQDSLLAAPLEAVTDRRAVLAGIVVATLIGGCRRGDVVEARHPPVDPPADPVFHRLSMALTGHRDLDALTAARLSAGFAQLAPDLHGGFGTLAKLAQSIGDPVALLAAADGQGLKPAALAIVAAWYTGTMATGPKAITVAYADALMQRPVADALAPPTYVPGGPAWWTAPPPAVGLPRAATPAPPPATVGTPEPKARR